MDVSNDKYKKKDNFCKTPNRTKEDAQFMTMFDIQVHIGVI